jgi:hypothetical protein
LKEDCKLPNQTFKTIVRIPIEPAPSDPSWIIKKHARRKFNPLEAEDFFRHEFEEEFKRLALDLQNQQHDSSMPGKNLKQDPNHLNQWVYVPTTAALRKVVGHYNSKKRNFMKCMDG